MKKIYSSLILLVCSTVAFAQWNFVGNAFSTDARGIYFLNSDTGYAVGNDAIAKTVDGGVSWVNDSTLIGVDLLRSVYFVDQDTGYVCGRLGQILKTIDQGATWNFVYNDPTQYFRSVDFPTPSMGLVGAQAGTILKTTNAGNDWTTINLGITDADVIQLDMVDPSIGYLVCADALGEKGYIFKTTDGGDSWSQVYSNVDSGLLALAVVDADTVYAGGLGQRILKSTDGGANWTVVYTGTIGDASYRGAFARTSIGIIMVDDFGYVNSTEDGGQNWINEGVTVDTALFCIHFPNSDIGFMGNENGNIYARHFNCSLPDIPGPIAGNDSVCGGTQWTYTINSIANADSYSWTVPSDATIISGQGDTSIVVQFGASSGDVSVAGVSSSCGPGESVSLSVQVIPAPQPTGITGSLSVCQGSQETYTTSSIEGVIDYTWIVPSDAAILSGQGDTSIIVQFGTQSGDISVTVSGNECGTGGTMSISVSVNQLPVTADITGEVTACQGVALNYSTSTVLYADSYQWTVPGDATINSGQGTTTINVTFGAQSGDITVTAVSNSCGNGNTTSFSVTITPIPAIPTFIFGDTATCAGDTAIYYIDGVAGADSYTWVVPSTCTILSGQGDTSISVLMGAVNGYVKVSATNSCGTSDQMLLAIVVHPVASPVITVLGGDSLKSSSPIGNQWYYNGEPIPGATSKYYVATQNGSYSVVVTSPFGCSATSPPVEITNLGISGIVAQGLMEIYPNPSSGNTLIEFPMINKASIVITDVQGKKVLEQNQLSGGQFDFDASRFAKGIYLIRVLDENDKLIGQKKFIVQ